MVIGARARHGQQIAGPDVGGQVDVADDLVARLAVPACHGHLHARSERMPVGQRDSVFRAVQGDARVVAHAAVHRDERPPARLGLDRAHAVQRDSGPRTDGPARFDDHAGPREPFGGTRGVEGFVDDLGQCGQVQRLVAGNIRNTVSATDVQLGQRHAMGAADIGHRGDQPADRLAVGFRVGDQRSDVAVQAHQFELGTCQYARHGLEGMLTR